uniref:Uncharacterized protein LOC110222943 isoform X2 n=1 Tax=Phascolarctos cinereus TaxID=38626 RepID=A0A6P5LZE4_PHACI|nr:uncharacterized protein LOC110222943 isoform X2 [Phascolarctos cinereus]
MALDSTLSWRDSADRKGSTSQEPPGLHLFFLLWPQAGSDSHTDDRQRSSLCRICNGGAWRCSPERPAYPVLSGPLLRDVCIKYGEWGNVEHLPLLHQKERSFRASVAAAVGASRQSLCAILGWKSLEGGSQYKGGLVMSSVRRRTSSLLPLRGQCPGSLSQVTSRAALTRRCCDDPVVQLKKLRQTKGLALYRLPQRHPGSSVFTTGQI